MEDGLRVLEVLQRYKPDILLLDLNMPGLSGLATLQQLQAGNSKTRVILLTASENEHEFVQALKLGSCDRAEGCPACIAEVLPKRATRLPFGRRHRDLDRNSTRLNSSHSGISYAVFC